MIFIKALFYHKPRKIQFTRLFARYKITNKKEKSLSITGLEHATSVITDQSLNQCATPTSIYIDLR